MPDQSPNLDSLFFSALEIASPGERAAFLDQACGDNQELRQEIDQLLKSHEQSGSFLAEPAADLDLTVMHQSGGTGCAQSLQAGLASAFSEDQAIVLGHANHSVLKMLGQILNGLPQVILRESAAEGAGPILQPKSAEMPQQKDPNSRYQLQGEIARGGMGAILKGRDTDLGRELAIKVLLDSHMDKPDIIQRFVEEAQIGGQLQHPGIAPIYELGQFADRRPFFAMKLVKGETLSKLLADREDAATERGKFIGIFEQVCQTLAYAHSRGVIHRDLKPANIMVGAFGEVQVMDWGLAKVLPAGGIADEKKQRTMQQGQSIIQALRRQEGSDTPGTLGNFGSQTLIGSVMGTPAYMPPEQALGEIDNMDERADVFGLGAILCQILTGKPPYVADDSAGAFRMAARGKLEDCFERLETCAADEDLIVLTKQCLELEPTARPRNASVLAERVTDYLESVETKLRKAEIERVTQAERAEAESRRVEQQQRSASTLRKIVGGLAVATLVAALACGAALLANQRANQLARIAMENEADANFFAGEAAAKATQARDNAARAEAESALARKAEQAFRELATMEAAAKALAQQETQRAEQATAQAKVQLARSEALLYASKLMLAQTDFESGNGGLALHYLNECQPNLRGWEHRYLSTRVNARQTLTGHTAPVHSAAFSPDGKRILTGSWDHTARVWDAATGQEVLALQGQVGYVMCVAFSPDGQRIVTAGGPWGMGEHPGEVIVWDSATGELLVDIKGHNYCVWSMAFSPDGKRIVAGGGDWGYGPGEVKVWDVETGHELLSLQEDVANVRAVAFSPDGQQILTGSSDAKAKVWDASTGQLLSTIQGNGRPVQSVAFSPDGRHIVTGVGAWGIGDGEAQVWDAATGQAVITLTGHKAAVLSVAFSPDGQRIASGSWDQTIKVWNSQTGKELFTLKGHEGHVHSVAFSPDGRRIVSSSKDTTAKVWDAENGQEVPTLMGHTDGMTSIAFSNDGQRIVTGSMDKTAKVWNAASDRQVLTLHGLKGMMHATFSLDGQYIVTGSDVASVWDATTGQELRVLDHGDVVMGVAFSPDGKHIVTGGWDQTAKMWDALTGQALLTLRGHAGYVSSVALSPDGTRIVTGSWDKTAKVWDAVSGQEIFSLLGHAGYVMSVAFSPDGTRIITGSFDNTAKVWDVATGQELLTLKGHTAGSVRSVAFSPDGARIVTGGDDRTARLWDAETGYEVLTLEGHTEAVYAVAWSPDGNQIVTGVAGQNATAKVWHAGTGKELLVIAGHSEMVTSVAFSDDGQRVFAWDAQQNVLAWSVASGEPAAPVDPPPEPLPGPARSSDGFHYAVPEGKTVVVSDTSPLPENAWPLPNAVQRIGYHSAKATLAAHTNQLFAAEYHLQQVERAEATQVRDGE